MGFEFKLSDLGEGIAEAEIRCWYQRIQDPEKRRAIAEQAMRSLIGESVQVDLRLEALRAQIERTTAAANDAQAAFERLVRSKSWRLTAPLRAVNAWIKRRR